LCVGVDLSTLAARRIEGMGRIGVEFDLDVSAVGATSLDQSDTALVGHLFVSGTMEDQCWRVGAERLFVKTTLEAATSIKDERRPKASRRGGRRDAGGVDGDG